MKAVGVGAACLLIAFSAWPAAVSDGRGEVRAFLAEYGLSESGGSSALPRFPGTAFDLAVKRFSAPGVAASARLNAALLAARRDWALLSAQDKEAVHPLFHPPIEGLGTFADARYEIRFPRGFGAARVAQMAVALDEARAAVGERLPSLAERAEGAVMRAVLTPFPPDAAFEGYVVFAGESPLAVVNARLAPARMREEVFYQGTYALLLSAVPDAAPWLVEATALWLAHQAGFENYTARIEPPTDATFAAGVGARPLLHPADPSFLFYLDSGLRDASRIDATWKGVSSGLAFRDALRGALEAKRWSLDVVLPRFSLWTLHRGERSAEDAFPEGAAWPEFRPDAHAQGAPFVFSGDGVAPWGFAAVSVRDRGAVRLSFEGAGGAFSVQASLRSREGGAEWVSFGARREGGEALSLPTGVASDVVVTAVLLESHDDAPAWKITGDTLQDYPSRVANVRAQERDGGVRVSWTALSEDNVAGWRVWRVQPNGHRVLLTPIPLPSPGDSASPMHYTWFDLVPRYHAGTYGYRIEAVTRDGLSAEHEAGAVRVVVPPSSPRR